MRHTRHHPLTEMLRTLPRLVVMTLMIGGPLLAVGQGNAASGAFQSGKMLVGGEIAKPNGVGLVLAVGLQRVY